MLIQYFPPFRGDESQSDPSCDSGVSHRKCLAPVSHMMSTSCTMKLQLLEQNCDGNVCQRVSDDTKRNYIEVVTNMMMVKVDEI